MSCFPCDLKVNLKKDAVHPYKDQNYAKIKQECIESKTLFTDPTFPAKDRSVYFSREPPCEIIWKRPGDIVEHPKFVQKGLDRDDLTQGSLGNCWFVAACSCITQDRKLLEKVVPGMNEQEWYDYKPYAGIFHFQFWWTGQWMDVVIDDLLPTRKGKLLFVHSKDSREFWSALLEKAYAKLFGSYESLIAGKPRDALVNMTGGIGEGLTISKMMEDSDKEKVFTEMENAFKAGSLMTCAVTVSDAKDMEAKMDCGLIRGHAYSITEVKRITLGEGLLAYLKGDTIEMVRVRNPWGQAEWNGPWSDSSPEWEKVSDRRKTALGFQISDNGEFWMHFDDFSKYFTNIDICYIFNTSLSSFKLFQRFHAWFGDSDIQSWRPPHRAGGCLNYDTFLYNHQYVLKVPEQAKFMMSLEQEDRRAILAKGVRNYTIGITITTTDLNRKYRMHVQGDRVDAGPFSNSRSVITNVTLEQGNYLIVPSTFEPNLEGQFIIRVYSKKNFTFKELDRDLPAPTCCNWYRPYKSVVAVTIIRAEDLDEESNAANMSPYCIVKCEGEALFSPTINKCIKPRWNVRATFYRQDSSCPIYVEVWNDIKLQVDTFLGFVEVRLEEHHVVDEMLRYPLLKRGPQGAFRKSRGHVWIQAQTSLKLDDL